MHYEPPCTNCAGCRSPLSVAVALRYGGATVVALAETLDKPLNLLTLAELKSVDKQFGRDAQDVFDLQRAMAKRNFTGAPGTKEVAKQLARWREQLS